MSDAKKLPYTVHTEFNGPAIVETSVTRETALNGNSGESSFSINVSGSVWLGAGERARWDAVSSFTVGLAGESEHALMADALRWIADQLDRPVSA